MIRFHRPAVALVAALLAIVALASPAAAHASLVRSNPADASVLDEAPGQVELTFSEPVSVDGSSVEFIDAEGTRHDVEIVGHGQSTSVLLIDLGDIPDGLYSLRWTAFSSSDGHVTKGMLVWGIGTDADLSQADFAAPSEPVPPVEVLTRWALYIGLAAVLGAFLVQAGVLVTVQRRFSAASEAPWHQTAANRVESIVRVGSRIAAAAAVLLIVEQLWKAYSAGGQGVLPAIETSLLSTAWGRWALLRAVALIVLAVVLPRLHSRSRREALMMVAVGSAVLAQAAGGHSAGTETVLLSVINDAVHLAASLAWAGAVFVLWRILRESTKGDQRRPVIAAVLSAFSPLATVLFSVAVITGVLSIGGQVRSLDALIGSLYGRAMVLKLALIAVVALAALVTRRSIAGPRPGRPIGVESVAAVALVAVVAMLTSISPANGAKWFPTIEPEARQLAIVQDDIQLGMTVSPNVPGQNLVLIDAISTRRPELAPIDRVLVRVTPADFEAATVVLEAQPMGPRGEYEVPTTAFAVAGRYRVELVVRRAALLDTVGDFTWSVASPAGSREVVVSDATLDDSTSLIGVAGAVALVLTLGWYTLAASVRERRMRDFEDYLSDPAERPEIEC